MFLNDIFGLKVGASANVTAFEDIKSDFYTEALCKFYVVILNNEEPHFQIKNSTVCCFGTFSAMVCLHSEEINFLPKKLWTPSTKRLLKNN